MFIVVH